MKIALVRKNYSPYGGAENYLKLAARGLKAKGHNVFIFSAGNWPDDVYAFCRVKTPNKPSLLSNLFFAINSRAELKKQSFDCIISFERTFYQDMYRAGDGCHREWLGKRSILEPFIKRMSFALNPLHLTLLYLEKQCFSNSRVIIANSMMVKSDIKKHYSIPDEKIKVIYNGVDLKRFSPPEKEQKKAEKNSLGIKEVKVILFAGSDFKRKGLGTLLRAAASLDMTDKKIIAAGKEHPHQYISLAKKLGIEDKVVFRGAERDMERLYRISDVFVLPTVYDPFSNATLEAMASGLPVVTTSSNGASELIENGVQGFVINDPLDADSFAGAVSKTLKQSDEMGRQARIKAEGFSIEKAVDEIIGVISELTNAV